jgi:hypothetical protein
MVLKMAETRFFSRFFAEGRPLEKNEKNFKGGTTFEEGGFDKGAKIYSVCGHWN